MKSQHVKRCDGCFNLIAANAASCESCGIGFEPSEPQSLVNKFRHFLRMDKPFEVIKITPAEPERFFNAREIETLLKLENMIVLELDDVPDWDKMFFHSKRLKKY